MSLPPLPHFDLPFRIGTHAAVVQQGTVEDLANCVEAILRTHIGFRKERLRFGVPDQTFREQPLDGQAIINQVILNEPRVLMILEQHPDLLDNLIARVRVSVSRREQA